MYLSRGVRLLSCVVASAALAAQQQPPSTAPSPVTVDNPNAPPPQVQQPPAAFDVRSLSNGARPAVAFIAVSDRAGKLIKGGTGFFVSADGKIVTNAHVIEGGGSATAKLENGATYNIQGVIKAAADKDLVLLQADAKGVPFLPIGKQELPDVGSRIAVIGSPFGLEGTVSEGIVSGHRTLKKDDQWLQITAAVSPGSSGSPLIDEQGKVVGVATFVLDKAQSLNFARPVSYVSELIEHSEIVTEPAPLWTVAADPKNVLLNDPEFIEAEAALQKDDAAKALKILNGLAPKYSENASLLFKFGVVYERLNLLEDSVQALQHAVKIDPTNGMAWTYLGVSYSKLRRLTEAKDAARQAVKVAPDLGPAWSLLGTIYQQENRTVDALDAFKKAAQFAPKDAEILNALKSAYSKANDPAGAQTAEAKLNELNAPNSGIPGATAPVAPAVPVSSVPREKYIELVAENLRGFERGDINALVSKYDDKIAYRDYGVVDREFIRHDLEKYFSRWPMTKTRLIPPIDVLNGKNPGEKIVRFRYEFRAASPDRRSFSVGNAWTVWSIAEKPTGFKVWGEAQKVARRPGH